MMRQGAMTILRQSPQMTIQDTGRRMYRHNGVSVAGVMDILSADLANAAVRNDDMACSVLECALIGPKLKFDRPACLAWHGANCNISVNGVVLDEPIVKVDCGDVLDFGPINSGNYLYIAIHGGWQMASYLGSMSSDKWMMINTLQKGQIVHYVPSSWLTKGNVKVEVIRSQAKSAIICYKGPEYNFLPEHLKVLLQSKSWVISRNSSRVAFVLTNVEKPNHNLSLPSMALSTGMVQMTPGGTLMAIGPDGPVTGGYPRVLFLPEASRSLLFQSPLGSDIRFDFGGL